MLEWIKNKYYRYGCVAASGEEVEKTKDIFRKYDVKLVKKSNILYKIIVAATLPKIYQSIADEIFVYKAKDRDETIEVMRDFMYFVGGHLTYTNI